MERFDTIRSQFRDTSRADVAGAVCKLVFSQHNPVNEPHRIGDVATISVNGDVAGKLSFGDTPTEPKSKTLLLDVTDRLSQRVNTLSLELSVDKDFAQAGFRSEAEFTLTLAGARRVHTHYDTSLPFRLTQEEWFINSSEVVTVTEVAATDQAQAGGCSGTEG